MASKSKSWRRHLSPTPVSCRISGVFLAGRIVGRNVLVAIDGPAGSGKSSVARAVAGRLGLINLNTGATYRAVALVALRDGLSIDDGAALATVGAGMDLMADGVYYGGERIQEDAL